MTYNYNTKSILSNNKTFLTIISLLTPAEKDEILITFYKKCLPPGFWKRIKNNSNILTACKKGRSGVICD